MKLSWSRAFSLVCVEDSYLVDEIRCSQPPTNKLNWGNETYEPRTITNDFQHILDDRMMVKEDESFIKTK